MIQHEQDEPGENPTDLQHSSRPLHVQNIRHNNIHCHLTTYLVRYLISPKIANTVL